MCIPVWSGPLSRIVACAVLLSACGGDSSGAPPNNNPPPSGSTADIDIPEGASLAGPQGFNPNPKMVALGGAASVTVRWVNRDITGGDYQQGTATVHNIVSNTQAFTGSGNLGGNDTYSIQLSQAGDYDYHCSIHPTMTGRVTVTP